MKKRVLSFLPLIAVLLYYVIGGFIHSAQGRPEAFVYDKNYGDILKFAVILLPFYLTGINLPGIKKSGVAAYFEMLLVELLYVVGILLGDRYILTINAGGVAEIFWDTAYSWAFSVLSNLWWLMYFAINRKKRKKEKIFFDFLPIVILLAEMFIYFITEALRLTEFKFIWQDELTTIILAFFVIKCLIAPIIYPFYLALLNRHELKTKTCLFKMAGIMVLYNLLSACFIKSVSGEASVNFIFGVFDIGLYLCEGLTFLISYFGLALYYKKSIISQ